MKILTMIEAMRMGYSADKRRRRRQHRRNARYLMAAGTFMNPGHSPRGSIPQGVAAWHLAQARGIK